MIRRFTEVAEKVCRAFGSQVSGLFPVITDNGVTSIGIVAGLMAMAASARLTFVPEVKQNFTKAHEVGYGTFNSDKVMTDTILNIFPSRFTEIATARA